MQYQGATVKRSEAMNSTYIVNIDIILKHALHLLTKRIVSIVSSSIFNAWKYVYDARVMMDTDC